MWLPLFPPAAGPPMGEQVPQQLLDGLEAVFSRSGFTKGYLTGQRGREMFGTRTKEDVTGATEKVFSSLRNLYRGRCRESVRFWTWKSRGGAAPLRAGWGRPSGRFRRAPGEGLSLLPRERCEQQLKRQGHAFPGGGRVHAGKRVFPCGVSTLNALRREALEQLLRLRGGAAPSRFPKGAVFSPAPKGTGGAAPCAPISERPLKCVRRQETAGKLCCPWKRRLKSCSVCGKRDSLSFFGHPARAVRRGKQDSEADEGADAGGLSGFCGGGIWELSRWGRDLGARVHGGFSLNVFNTAALDFFQKLGLSTAELSMELTAGEVSRLGGGFPGA